MVAGRVLIVSASVGGGHDGVAAELAARLATAGVASCTVDFLDQLPCRLGRAGRRLYESALRFAPGSYDALYRLWLVWGWAWRPMVGAVTLLSRRRLARRIRESSPAVVVSVYPLASLALGRMRTKRWLQVPTVTYLTDFSAHPLWVHPGIDVHLGISGAALGAAQDRGARTAVRVRPLVRSAFGMVADRSELRMALDLGPDDVAVLLVSGSWGVGAVAAAVAAIGSFGAFRVLCVCGRNERLQRELEQQGIAIVIGWTDRMAEIMAAVDVVVENAGGLTCMEALASGRPVVTFDPIAGHGRHNAELMARAGVVRYARDHVELRAALDAVACPYRNLAAEALFSEPDAGDEVRALVAAQHPIASRARQPVLVRRATGMVAAGFAAYLSATTVFATAAAHGVGVDASGRDATRPTVVGIRLGASQFDDPDVRRALVDNGVVAVVDAPTACRAADATRLGGVGLASTGGGSSHRFAWTAARDDVEEASEQIVRCTGVTPRWFVALRRPTAFDWVLARDTPGRIILTPSTVRPDAAFERLAPHHLYVVDATTVTVAVARQAIIRLGAARVTREIATESVN